MTEETNPFIEKHGRLIVKVGIGVVLFVIAFFAFAPENRTHSVTAAFKRMFNDQAHICLEGYKKEFLDPDSARLALITDNDGYDDPTRPVFRIHVSATTRGGGRTTEEFWCRTDAAKPGQLAAAQQSVELMRRVRGETKRLNDEIEQYRQRNREYLRSRGLE